MALIFCDSFDHYLVADVLSKWTASAANSIGPTYGRNGTNGVFLNASSNYLTKFLPSTYTTLYAGFAYYCPYITAGPLPIIQFMETSTVHVGIYVEDETGKIYATRNTTKIGITTNQVIHSGVWCHIQVKVYIHDSAGTVDVLVNSVNVLSLTGQDTLNGGAGVINTIKIFGKAYFDDFWSDDSEYLGDCRIECLFPSAAGDTTAWTPSAGANYECVDEAAPDSDTSYVSSSTADQVDTYTFGNLVTTAGTVKGVQVSAFARKDDAGSRNIALVARPGSTDRPGGSQAVADTYNYYRQLWEVNPDTSAAWSIAEVNAAKFGIKLVS